MLQQAFGYAPAAPIPLPPARPVDLYVLRGRRLPRKIFFHAVQLNALPDALISKMMERLTNCVKQSAASIVPELEAGAGAVFQIEKLDRVVETAGGTNNWDGTILQTVNLIQATRFVARRHEKHVGAGFDFVRDGVVVGDFDADTIRVRFVERAEKVFVLAIAGAENDERHVFAHDFRGDFGDEIETFLIGEARDDTNNRAAGNVRQAESLQQILFAREFAG